MALDREIVNTSSPGCAISATELLAEVADAPFRDVQYGHTEGVVDLTWGHPDPSSLATDAIAAAVQHVLGDHGWQALAYGAPAGAESVRHGIAEHLSHVDAPIDSDNIVVTAGSSGALDLVLTLLTTPGDVVCVEQPTYFLALRILADHGVTVVGLGNDEHGPTPDSLAAAARDGAARGARTFVYLVPTYANPTGRCLPRPRIDELLRTAAVHDVVVIEDDVYRDTTPTAPPSMFSIDPDRVIRLGSFAKSLSPGLRVGYITAAPALAERIAGCGLLDSGGGVNHFAAMVVGEVLRSGQFRDIVALGQDRYAARRTALVDALDPSILMFETPAGGFFVWMALPDGMSSTEVIARGRAAGVLVTSGDHFFVGTPDRQYIRASFSMLDVDELRLGATRLNGIVRDLAG